MMAGTLPDIPGQPLLLGSPLPAIPSRLLSLCGTLYAILGRFLSLCRPFSLCGTPHAIPGRPFSLARILPPSIPGMLHAVAEILGKKAALDQLREGIDNLPGLVRKRVDAGHVHGEIPYQHPFEDNPIGKNQISRALLKNRRQFRKGIVPLQGNIVPGGDFQVAVKRGSQLPVQPVLQMVQPHFLSVGDSPHDIYQIVPLPHHRRIGRSPLLPQLQVAPVSQQPHAHHRQNQQKNQRLHQNHDGSRPRQRQDASEDGDHMPEDVRQTRPLFRQMDEVPHLRLLRFPIGHACHAFSQIILHLPHGHLHPDIRARPQRLLQGLSQKGGQGKRQDIQQNLFFRLPLQDAVQDCPDEKDGDEGRGRVYHNEGHPRPE